ncbi:MAG: DUF378 domain-containing protein [Candidatus Doudnabacteria bacterium]|nr:DUF378 domain-containing protein [Candidatus Doudnabacteria bacterium]
MKALHLIAFILVVIGGINLGLIGAANFDLVAKILGTGMVTKVVYVLVGLSALVLVFTHWGDCKKCESKTTVPGM